MGYYILFCVIKRKNSDKRFWEKIKTIEKKNMNESKSKARKWRTKDEEIKEWEHASEAT